MRDGSIRQYPKLIVQLYFQRLTNRVFYHRLKLVDSYRDKGGLINYRGKGREPEKYPADIFQEILRETEENMDLKLCDSDYRFMTVVWENAPVNSGQLVKLCAEQLGWKKSTTYTMIKKLSNKGFIQNVDTMVSALVSKEECQRDETRYFMQERFGGSLPEFFAAFLRDRKISDDEAVQMKEMIEEYRQKK